MAGVFPNLYNFHKSDAECKEILDIIKAKISLSEIKARDIYRGNGVWRQVSPEIRDKVIEFYLQWLIDRNHKVIISAIDNKKFFDIKKKSEFKIIADKIKYPYLLGGLHIALVIQKENRKKDSNKGKTLLIFDQEDEFENDLTELIFQPPDFIDEFVDFDAKKEKSRLNQIIDTAFFVRSHHSAMAQVADVVSYLFRLNIELNDYGHSEKYKGETKKISKWINLISSQLIVTYPKKQTKFLDFINSTKANGV